MDAPPKVSVLLSVYNEELYVREAIRSILDQTFTDFELIIINDGSTDGTRLVLESFSDNRIRVYTQENKGLTESLNTGLSLARGAYIGRMDGNDVSLPKRLERQVYFLDSHLDTGLVGAFYFTMDKSGNTIKRYTYPVQDKDIRETLPYDNPFCHSLAMFRKTCIDTVGNYRIKIGPAEDYDLWFRISEKCRVANIPEPLHKVRSIESGITLGRRIDQLRAFRLVQYLGLQRKSKGTDDLEQMSEAQLLALLDKLHPKTEENLRSAALSTALHLANVSYCAGNYTDALAQVHKAMKAHFLSSRATVLLLKIIVCSILPGPVVRIFKKSRDRAV